MLELVHNKQIWVLIFDKSGIYGGDWYCYQGTFQEEAIREVLGGANAPESAFSSNYTYLAGGTVDKEWFTTLVETLGLSKRLTHRPSELSGGQQQRVAIARALIAQPDVVFADEPTGNLDSRSGAEVLSFLRRSVRELDRTIIMVTHDPAAAAYADRVVLIADGKIAGDISDPTPESALAGLDALRTVATR